MKKNNDLFMLHYFGTYLSLYYAQFKKENSFVSLHSLITCYFYCQLPKLWECNDEIMPKEIIAFSCFYLRPDFDDYFLIHFYF